MQFRIMKLTNVIFKNIKTKDVTLDDGRVIDNVELTFDPKPQCVIAFLFH
jgi:hypothetical protein